MSAVTIPATSREYLYVPVTTDATPDLVEVALASGAATPTTWAPATITPDGDARIMLGTDLPLSPGRYRVVVRITAEPETIVRDAGWLTVT